MIVDFAGGQATFPLHKERDADAASPSGGLVPLERRVVGAHRGLRASVVTKKKDTCVFLDSRSRHDVCTGPDSAMHVARRQKDVLNTPPIWSATEDQARRRTPWDSEARRGFRADPLFRASSYRSCPELFVNLWVG